jgi:hypothetical protein
MPLYSNVAHTCHISITESFSLQGLTGEIIIRNCKLSISKKIECLKNVMNFMSLSRQ